MQSLVANMNDLWRSGFSAGFMSQDVRENIYLYIVFLVAPKRQSKGRNVPQS